jgi:hypothetical protein
MQAIKALAQSQRVSQAHAALHTAPIALLMHAIVGCHQPQLKMPRQDAYQ